MVMYFSVSETIEFLVDMLGMILWLHICIFVQAHYTESHNRMGA